METGTPEQFLTAYSDYIKTMLLPTRREIREIFKRWRSPLFWARYTTKSRLPAPSPIQRAITRIKRPESVVDKISRKPSSFPDGLEPNSFKIMNDALGARIVVYFLGSLPLVDHEIRSGDNFEISSADPPIAYLTEGIARPSWLGDIRTDVKPSGYVSVHYVLRLRESALPLELRPWFELQLRTMIEDVWAEIEHVLGYKPSKRTSLAVRKQFKLLSSQIICIDEFFNFLYEELSRFQEEANFRDDDPLNAENLPGVLAELGIGCSQREIDGMLKILVSNRIQLLGDLRQAATVRKIEIIKDTHRSTEGREPVNFELVAHLAAIRDARTEEEMVQRVKAQIALLKAWDGLKRHEMENWDLLRT